MLGMCLYLNNIESTVLEARVILAILMTYLNISLRPIHPNLSYFTSRFLISVFLTDTAHWTSLQSNLGWTMTAFRIGLYLSSML